MAMATMKPAGMKNCCFCGKQSNERYGIFFEDPDSGTSVHQYCMFFAAGLPQNGNDSEGFDGFLIEDILKEKRRTKRLKCSFCKKTGASVGCAVWSCKINCHFTCGQEFGMMHQFFGDFRSYCSKHKPVQDLSSFDLSQKELVCAICFEDLNENHNVNLFLKMPCCKDNFFHRTCLQQQALSSGYFFRCPTCNNQDEFIKEMKKFGIYVPERDASWEDGVAYSDLLQPYCHCDSKYCQCPKGKAYSKKSGHWEVLVCKCCGQAGIHRKCAEFLNQIVDFFQCDICSITENKSRFGNTILNYTKQCQVSMQDILINPGIYANGAVEIKKGMESHAESRQPGYSTLLSMQSQIFPLQTSSNNMKKVSNDKQIHALSASKARSNFKPEVKDLVTLDVAANLCKDNYFLYTIPSSESFGRLSIPSDNFARVQEKSNCIEHIPKTRIQFKDQDGIFFLKCDLYSHLDNLLE